jgi:hypothetical protein
MVIQLIIHFRDIKFIQMLNPATLGIQTITEK